MRCVTGWHITVCVLKCRKLFLLGMPLVTCCHIQPSCVISAMGWVMASLAVMSTWLVLMHALDSIHHGLKKQG